MSDKIQIPYSIERISKTQFQGKIFYPGETFVFEPTTKGRCTNRLCDRLQPLLLKKLEETWPDGIDDPVTEKDIKEPPETTKEARDEQLKTLPPDTGEVKAEPPHPPPARGLECKPYP